VTRIRPAVAADLDAVSSLEREVFDRNAWSPRAVEQELEAVGQGRHLLVAVADAKVVGYAALSYSGDTCDLLRVAVSPAYRRRGIASELFTVLRAQMERRPGARVLLEVAADNRPALAFYSRLGFAEIDRRRRYYANSVDAVVMQLELPGAPGSSERAATVHSEVGSCPLEGPQVPARREGEA
jgi:[ribosomal protein S18]-alanine N-acetyltransferase